MALFSFGKRVKPKPFGFVPRYYDKDKEDLEARLARYDKEVDNVELMKARIRSRYRYHSGEELTYSQSSRKSSIRLILIIFALSLAAYLILQSDGIIRMLESMEGGTSIK